MFSVVVAAHLLVLLREWIFPCSELHQNPSSVCIFGLPIHCSVQANEQTLELGFQFFRGRSGETGCSIRILREVTQLRFSKGDCTNQVCEIVNDSLKADMGLHYSNPASLGLSASKCACAQFVCISLEYMIPFLCVAGIQEM